MANSYVFDIIANKSGRGIKVFILLTDSVPLSKDEQINKKLMVEEEWLIGKLTSEAKPRWLM